MISVISYEVNECMKHMLLNDILQLVVLLDNYTTLETIYHLMLQIKIPDMYFYAVAFTLYTLVIF